VLSELYPLIDYTGFVQLFIRAIYSVCHLITKTNLVKITNRPVAGILVGAIGGRFGKQYPKYGVSI
jgi:hypothetical protein